MNRVRVLSRIESNKNFRQFQQSEIEMECSICQKSYKNAASLRSHKYRDHPNSCEKKTAAEKRQQKTEKQRQRREEQKESSFRRRDLYTIDDVSSIGRFVSYDEEVQKMSGACIYLVNQGDKTFGGYGVFAGENLYVGDVITKYEGVISNFDRISDKNYAMQLGNTTQYLNGIQQPIIGKGLGSLINKEVRKHDVKDGNEIWDWGENTRKNIEYIRDRKSVYIEVCRDLKPDSQLFAVYGDGGYRCTKN